MRRFFTALTALSLLLSLGTDCCAWEDVLYLTADSPPTTVLYGANRTGYLVELIRAVQKEMGVSGKIEFVPWARGIRMMGKDRPSAMFPMFRTPERETMFQWGGPIQRFEWGLFQLANATVKRSGLDEARNATAVGVIRDDSRIGNLERLGFRNLDLAGGHMLNVEKLIRGRVEMIVFSKTAIEGMILTPSRADVKLRAVVEFEPEDLYVAFSNSTDPAYVREWNAAFERLSQSGSIRDLQRKWRHAEGPDGPEM